MNFRDYLVKGTGLAGEVVKTHHKNVTSRPGYSSDSEYGIFAHFIGAGSTFIYSTVLIEPLALGSFISVPLIFRDFGLVFLAATVFAALFFGAIETYIRIKVAQKGTFFNTQGNIDIGNKAVTVFTPLMACPLLALDQAIECMGHLLNTLGSIFTRDMKSFKQELLEAMTAHTKVYQHLLNTLTYPIINLVEFVGSVKKMCSNTNEESPSNLQRSLI